MITAEKAYEKFIIKINKNAQTNNISCSRGKFVLIYNENQNKEIEYILEEKRKEDDIRYIQKLLSTSKIVPNKKEKRYTLFELPTNFFDLSTILGVASKDCCKEEVLELYEIKSEDENSFMFDEFNKPSFEFREAPYYLSSGKIKVFKLDFEYDNLHLTYYRYPTQISLESEDNPESQFSNTQIELDEKIVDRIISRCASDFELNNNNSKFQADDQRAKIK